MKNHFIYLIQGYYLKVFKYVWLNLCSFTDVMGGLMSFEMLSYSFKEDFLHKNGPKQHTKKSVSSKTLFQTLVLFQCFQMGAWVWSAVTDIISPAVRAASLLNY